LFSTTSFALEAASKGSVEKLPLLRFTRLHLEKRNGIAPLFSDPIKATGELWFCWILPPRIDIPPRAEGRIAPPEVRRRLPRQLSSDA
jgi:hypothetical protein